MKQIYEMKKHEVLYFDGEKSVRLQGYISKGKFAGNYSIGCKITKYVIWVKGESNHWTKISDNNGEFVFKIFLHEERAIAAVLSKREGEDQFEQKEGVFGVVWMEANEPEETMHFLWIDGMNTELSSIHITGAGYKKEVAQVILGNFMKVMAGCYEGLDDGSQGMNFLEEIHGKEQNPA